MLYPLFETMNFPRGSDISRASNRRFASNSYPDNVCETQYFIRQNTAHEIVSRMKYLGQSLREAAKGTLGDLKGMGGDGGLIGIDQDGCGR